MTTNPFDEAAALVKKNRRVAVVLPEKSETDEIAAALGTLRAIGNLKKESCLFFSGTYPRVFQQLFQQNLEAETKAGPEELSDFAIEINCKTSPVKELRYQKHGDRIVVLLTPADRPIKKEDVLLKDAQAEYGLVVAVGLNELGDAGSVFEKNAELLYDKPKIAMCLSAKETALGGVALADPAGSSFSEIAADFFLDRFPEAVDEKAATFFLLGILEKTKNFRSGQVRPKTFAVAERLLERGGRRNDIVRFLSKTKPLSLLQLWGRSLLRTRLNQEQQTLWMALTREDFVKTGAAPDEGLPFVLQHTEEHFLTPKTLALLWQHPEKGEVRVVVRTKQAVPHQKEFGPFASFREAENALEGLAGA